MEWLTALSNMTGIWTALPTLRAEETWIQYVVVQHSGVVAFLVMDIILLMASVTLTTAQSSQVIDQTIIITILYLSLKFSALNFLCAWCLS